MQVFLTRKREQAKLSDLGIRAPERSVRDIAQLSLYHGVVRLIRKRNNWALFLWKRKRNRKYVQKNASLFFVYQATRVPRRHDFPGIRCSLCYSLEVSQCLDRKLPGRWMGRGGPTDRPAHSPDLTPCGHFLWGHVKDLVYRAPPRSISELKSKIRSAIATINEGTLQEFLRNMKTRLGFVVRKQGSFLTSHELKN